MRKIISDGALSSVDSLLTQTFVDFGREESVLHVVPPFNGKY